MSSTRQLIEEFLSQKRIAVVGVKRQAKGFAFRAFELLSAQGHEVVIVNPKAESIGGHPSYPSLLGLPEPVDGALLITPKRVTAEVVRQAAEARIPRIWIQQTSETAEAIDCAKAAGIDAVVGECIFMRANPRGIHRFHRWLTDIMEKVPL
jgi:uncharacterized protein